MAIANYTENNLEKKQRTDATNQTKKIRAVTLDGAIEKSQILQSQYLKNKIYLVSFLFLNIVFVEI